VSFVNRLDDIDILVQRLQLFGKTLDTILVLRLAPDRVLLLGPLLGLSLFDPSRNVGSTPCLGRSFRIEPAGLLEDLPACACVADRPPRPTPRLKDAPVFPDVFPS
jgi:hypothetical protein